MWLYAHWSTNGSTYVQPFHKEEKAVEHAFMRLHSYVANDLRNYGNKNMPKELTMVKLELERLDSAFEKTVDNARRLIRMYEDYMRLVLGRQSAYHDIREVKIVE